MARKNIFRAEFTLQTCHLEIFSSFSDTVVFRSKKAWFVHSHMQVAITGKCFTHSLHSCEQWPLVLRTPRPATGVSRALRARSVPGVSPKTRGVQGSVRRGVSGALRAPGSGVSKKCPESVPGVSKRCPGHSGETLGTLFGHPVGHSLGHPRFSGM